LIIKPRFPSVAF